MSKSPNEISEFAVVTGTACTSAGFAANTNAAATPKMYGANFNLPIGLFPPNFFCNIKRLPFSKRTLIYYIFITNNILTNPLSLVNLICNFFVTIDLHFVHIYLFDFNKLFKLYKKREQFLFFPRKKSLSTYILNYSVTFIRIFPLSMTIFLALSKCPTARLNAALDIFNSRSITAGDAFSVNGSTPS